MNKDNRINNKYNLAIFDSHLIQYRAPFFSKLSRHPEIELSVYYYSSLGLKKGVDRDFGISFSWDRPLTEGYNYSFLNNPLAIIREIKRKRFSAILIYGYYLWNNWIIVAAAFCLRIPVIFCGETVFFSSPSLIKKSALRLFFSGVKSFLYIGKKSREFYDILGITKERLFFFPYSVDNDFFISEVDRNAQKRAEIKSSLGLPQGLPVILYCSKLIPRKRPLDLLVAFQKLQEEAMLIFVGEGKLKGLLQGYTADNKIKNVFFPGFKNQSELPKIYAIGDLFVLPSSYEPWGLVVNEAMCAALPVITTEGVSAAYDLVKDGENGYLLRLGDKEGLLRALKRLISDSALRESMGRRSRQLIEKWNYDICIKGLMDALAYSFKDLKKQ